MGDSPNTTEGRRETCEVPGCDRPVRELRPQSSGDVLRVCGEPHVYGGPGAHTMTPTEGAER